MFGRSKRRLSFCTGQIPFMSFCRRLEKEYLQVFPLLNMHLGATKKKRIRNPSWEKFRTNRQTDHTIFFAYVMIECGGNGFFSEAQKAQFSLSRLSRTIGKRTVVFFGNRKKSFSDIFIEQKRKVTISSWKTSTIWLLSLTCTVGSCTTYTPCRPSKGGIASYI